MTAARAEHLIESAEHPIDQMWLVMILARDAIPDHGISYDLTTLV
jgi:hypothetical protein